MTLLSRRVSLNVAAPERARDVQDDVTGRVGDLERSGIAAAGLTMVGERPLRGRAGNAVEVPGPGALVGVEPRGGLAFREGWILAARRAGQRIEVEAVTLAPVDLEVVGRHRAITVKLSAERRGRIPAGDELAAAGQESLAASRQATEAARARRDLVCVGPHRAVGLLGPHDLLADARECVRVAREALVAEVRVSRDDCGEVERRHARVRLVRDPHVAAAVRSLVEVGAAESES